MFVPNPALGSTTVTVELAAPPADTALGYALQLKLVSPAGAESDVTTDGSNTAIYVPRGSVGAGQQAGRLAISVDLSQLKCGGGDCTAGHYKLQGLAAVARFKPDGSTGLTDASHDGAATVPLDPSTGLRATTVASPPLGAAAAWDRSFYIGACITCCWEGGVATLPARLPRRRHAEKRCMRCRVLQALPAAASHPALCTHHPVPSRHACGPGCCGCEPLQPARPGCCCGHQHGPAQ